ncbi:hypothetical protein G6F22_014206 [Rhizopus arrhizus]|nr:hypothetical protein G6F22_014206 [Rhizopus arrhizus]
MRGVPRAQAGGAIVAAAGGEGGGMEGIYLRAAGTGEGHVHAVAGGAAIAEPEERLAVATETDVVVGAALFGGHFHHHADLQRRQRVQEKGLAARQVGAVGGALVEERAQAFLALGGDPQARDQRGIIPIQRVAVMAVADLPDQLLGGGRGDRAGLVEQGQLAFQCLVQALGLDQLVDQADAQGGIGVEVLAGGEPAPGLARADGLDHVGRNHRRQQAEAAFGQAEAGRGAGDGDVAAGDQADAATEGGAVGPGQGWLGQLVQGTHQSRQRQRILAVVGLAGGGHATHPLHVGAGREGGAVAGHHHRADRIIAAGGFQRGSQPRDQAGVKGVVQLRPVQPEGEDGATALDLQSIVHGIPGSLHTCMDHSGPLVMGHDATREC